MIRLLKKAMQFVCLALMLVVLMAVVCHHVQSLPALPRRNELSDILRKSVC